MAQNINKSMTNAEWTFKLYLAMSKNYSTYQLGHHENLLPWVSMEKPFTELSLAKSLSALLRRNSPEGHHLYWFNTMKPINLPPSLSKGRKTIMRVCIKFSLWKEEFLLAIVVQTYGIL